MMRYLLFVQDQQDKRDDHRRQNSIIVGNTPTLPFLATQNAFFGRVVVALVQHFAISLGVQFPLLARRGRRQRAGLWGAEILFGRGQSHMHHGNSHFVMMGLGASSRPAELQRTAAFFEMARGLDFVIQMVFAVAGVKHFAEGATEPGGVFACGPHGSGPRMFRYIALY